MVGNKTLALPDFILVEDAKACAAIVLPEQPSQKVLRASNDLQEQLFEMSGARLPVLIGEQADKSALPGRIYVGYGTGPAQMGLPLCEGYPGKERVIVWREGNALALYGNDDGLFEGTAFAVNLLLEKLGCGWFAPDPLWQVVPKKQTLRIGFLQKDITPRFLSRQTWVLRTNPDFARRWYQGGVDKEIEHAFWRLFPREQYFAAHPDWYCQINGKRDPFAVEWWQMCYSNEELVRETAKKLAVFFRENPTYDQATLAANDGYFEGFCECEACKKLGNPGRTMLWFANRVAALLEPEFPDKQLMIFIYFPTLDPPDFPIVAHKNIILMFCKESCMCHSVDCGPDCGYHKRYTYEFGHTTYPRPWLDNCKEWIRTTQCQHVAVWEWNCPAAANPVWKDIPWVQGELAGRNQRCFEQLGAEYVYYDQGPVDTYNDTVDSYPLRWPLWYVSSKGMWDGHETPAELLLDACKKLFEAAGDLMYAYYACLADINGSCEAKAIAWHMPQPEEMYTPQAICRLDRILTAAMAQKSLLSKEAVLRLENQVALWEKAKQAIGASAEASAREAGTQRSDRA